MNISVLVSDPGHPVVPGLQRWAQARRDEGHEVCVVNASADLSGGDVLFLVSCSEIIGPAVRTAFDATLVLHASKLPEGRGWSPYIWAVVGGADEIHLCLLEAAEPVDTGNVWLRTSFRLEGHELLPEIHERLFASERELMTRTIHEWGSIRPERQTGQRSEPLPRRTPADSELDPELTIAAQFNLIRTADAERFPSFFDYRGHRYKVIIEKWPDADIPDVNPPDEGET